jgi:predicted ferric reductase
MNVHSWWYLSRAAGIMAWVVLAVTCMWGILLITRMLKPADRPAWLLDLHRYLGVLSIVATLAHVVVLHFDKWMHPSWKELFVPGQMTSPNTTAYNTAVTWGVIGLYLMVVIQISSYAMKQLPKKVWHGIHLTSYALFVIATVHGFMAGTDTSNMVLLLTAAGMIGILAFALVARILQGRAKKIQRAQSNALTRA